VTSKLNNLHQYIKYEVEVMAVLYTSEFTSKEDGCLHGGHVLAEPFVLLTDLEGELSGVAENNH